MEKRIWIGKMSVLYIVRQIRVIFPIIKTGHGMREYLLRF